MIQPPFLFARSPCAVSTERCGIESGVGFFKRLFSSNYRAALNAEAAGQLELAAEHYARAGQYDAAARMHAERAKRAESYSAEISALRDALHWAPDDMVELRAEIRAALGKALLSRAQSEGIGTQRDRQRVQEAAAHLLACGEYADAGAAWELIGNQGEAIKAYKQGGLIDKLEAVLDSDEERTSAARELREAFADYELHYSGGMRDVARDDLLRCVAEAEQKGEYRRLLDELESTLITGGRVTLQPRQKQPVTLCCNTEILMGRDQLCDLLLRSGNVSRRHAEISVRDGSDERFLLSDAGSRNGTHVGGMPISGAVPLIDSGSFDLGDEYTVDYQVDGRQLSLEVSRGMDRGKQLIVVAEGDSVDLQQQTGAPVRLRFERGRPFVQVADGVALTLNNEPCATGAQLIHGDLVVADGREIEVA